MEKKKIEYIINTLKSEDNKVLLNDIFDLQNDLNAYSDFKVICISSVDDDEIAAAFSKAFCLSFAETGEKPLLIDANLYSPYFEIFGVSDIVGSESKKTKSVSIINLDKFDLAYFAGFKYPTDSLKNGALQKIIKTKSKYDRFIVFMPNMKNKNDILLIKDDVDTVISVVIKNKTKTKDIFSCIKFCESNNLENVNFLLIK